MVVMSFEEAMFCVNYASLDITKKENEWGGE